MGNENSPMKCFKNPVQMGLNLIFQYVLIYLDCCLSSLGLMNILDISVIINKTLNITPGKTCHITGFLWFVFSDMRTERDILIILRSINSVPYQSFVCKQKSCLLPIVISSLWNWLKGKSYRCVYSNYFTVRDLCNINLYFIVEGTNYEHFSIYLFKNY